MTWKTFVCIDCGKEFDFDHRSGQRPLRCNYCRPRAGHKYGLVGDTVWLECVDCGADFEWEVRGGQAPIRCDYCRARAKNKYGLVGDTITVHCADCGQPFEWKVAAGGSPRQRCDKCWAKNEQRVDTAYAREWKAAHPERTQEIQQRWYDRHGYEWVRSKEARDPEFKRQRRETARRYRRTEKGRQAMRNARARRRNREADEGRRMISADEWRVTKEAFGYRCVYCGARLERFSQDHFYPLSRGGRTVLGNIVPACRRCNSWKHDRLPEDILAPEHYDWIVKVLRELSQK